MTNDPWSKLGIDHNTPMVTLETSWLSPGQRRQVVVANAIRVRLLNAYDPAIKRAFHEALGPGIPVKDLAVPFNSAKCKGISTCGLVAEHILWMAGADNPVYALPYYPIPSALRFSIARTVHFAMGRGCWAAKGEPRPGDVVVIGKRTKGEDYGGIEHMLVVAGVATTEGPGYYTIEGGQTEPVAGLQAIAIKTRHFPMVGKTRWCFSSGASHGRKVLGWVSPDRMPMRETCQAPIGWDMIRLD
jgi:hypothetical protein